jgi:hypothetical protein
MALALGLAAWLSGCSDDSLDQEAAAVLPRTEEAVDLAAESPSPVEREFWLAIAEEPGWHLDLAREEFVGGHQREAGAELEKVAALMNFEMRHSYSQKEEGLLLGSVEELREVSRGLKLAAAGEGGGSSLPELDHVSALAFRALAAHQAALAREKLLAGDARASGLFMEETVKAIRRGFGRSGIAEGHAMAQRLATAEAMGTSLVQEGDGSRGEILSSLDDLDRAVEALSNVLTDRRK